MKFQKNDIVTSATGWRPGVFVITDIHPTRPKNPYDGVSLINGRTYRLSEESLASKRVGVAEAGWNTFATLTPVDGDGTSVAVDQTFIKGQRCAQHEIAILGSVLHEAENRKRWEKLASLKPGDKFVGKVRGKIQHMTFRYVTDRGYKYVFVAENENGTRYKYPLSVVVV